MDVARSWERELFAGDLPGTRRVALRMAIVLGGPASDVLARLARLGVGGAQYDGWWFQHRRYRGIGDEPTGGAAPVHHSHGRQKFSWIHIDDLVAAVRFLEQREDLAGPVNLSTPYPSDNRALMVELRRVVHMPIGVPAPRWVLEPASWVRPHRVGARAQEPWCCRTGSSPRGSSSAGRSSVRHSTTPWVHAARLERGGRRGLSLSPAGGRSGRACQTPGLVFVIRPSSMRATRARRAAYCQRSSPPGVVSVSAGRSRSSAAISSSRNSSSASSCPTCLLQHGDDQRFEDLGGRPAPDHRLRRGGCGTGAWCRARTRRGRCGHGLLRRRGRLPVWALGPRQVTQLAVVVGRGHHDQPSQRSSSCGPPDPSRVRQRLRGRSRHGTCQPSSLARRLGPESADDVHGRGRCERRWAPDSAGPVGAGGEVVVFERERVPDSPVPRARSQGKHLHLLLAAGLDLLTAWSPASTTSSSSSARSGWTDPRLGLQPAATAHRETGRPALSMTRPLLEQVVRRRVAALANVRLQDGVVVDRVEVSDGPVVDGVVVDGAVHRADLVVDCSWTLAHRAPARVVRGLAPPVTRVTIDCATPAASSRAPSTTSTGASWSAARHPPSRSAGAVLPVEGDRWMVTVAGVHGDAPGTSSPRSSPSRGACCRRPSASSRAVGRFLGGVVPLPGQSASPLREGPRPASGVRHARRRGVQLQPDLRAGHDSLAVGRCAGCRCGRWITVRRPATSPSQAAGSSTHLGSRRRGLPSSVDGRPRREEPIRSTATSCA